ncbi:MAG: hypothetical protein E7667_05235 [Ruminococcaceae bacterium]|nr:hypothetical protein [Oscillospiraceae bacterium]
MKKSIQRFILALLMVSILIGTLVCFSGCSRNKEMKGQYTYKTYMSSLGTNWNPHSWEVNADSLMLEYLSTPLVGVSVSNSKEGIYTWVFEMAESITDVTAQHRDDLAKYKASIPNAQSPDAIEKGYVFEIKLNKNAKWQNGEAITADDYIYSMKALLDPKMKNYRANLYYSEESAIAGARNYYEGKTSDFSSVGLYKADDYTIRYVTQNPIDYNYFLNACTSNWLVYEKLYEQGKRDAGGVIVTNYGTSAETTMSYGPYKLSSIQTAKQAVFEQNPNWYGYESKDGKLISYTNFDIDGSKRRQYQTTKIIIDVMDEQSAKNAFLRGELSEWSPSADELSVYSSSDRLYKNTETYTMSLFFNTNKDVLRRLDAQSNKNSIVLSNKKFRQAISLAINRSKFVGATSGYVPEYALLNKLYFYDIYNDPKSSYRNSDTAMKGICKLYGVEYGEDKTHKTLTDAYNSISGYDENKAKSLMKQACDELVAAGLYKRGDAISIQIGWSKGALSADDNKQISLLNEFLNSAAAGSGFGKITLAAIGNIENRYAAVPAGEYAIGYGAWGGAAFYPFRNFQVYMDPDQYSINEAGCYDPKTETITLDVGGEKITKTWQNWSRSMTGAGEYADSDIETKLSILSQLECAFLETYYRIPLCSLTTSTMLSYQCDYYTEQYNIMYGFGGIRLLSYNYDDAQWAAYLKKQKNSLSYE